MKCMLLLLLVAPMALADTVAVECGPLRLGFDRDTGQWTGLAFGDREENLLGAAGGMDVEVAAPGHVWPATDAWRAEPPDATRSPTGCAISIVRRSGDWTVTASYEIQPDALTIKRQAAIRWDGAAPIKIVGTVLRVPGATLDGARDASWRIPGNYPVEEKPIASSAPGRSTRERGWTWADTGFAYARSREKGVAMLIAYALQLDHASVFVEEVEGGVSLVHRFNTLAILRPGDEINIGTQWVRIVEGGDTELRRAARTLAAQVNDGPPADRPAWLEGAVLEELHPWGRLEAWWAGDRGDRMPSIEAQLPYLRDLGVTGVWLLPISNKPPWVYFLPRFRNIDPQVTTPKQLRSFIATGHELGIHTLMDLVTYGVSPDSPDVASLPDSVWCLKENGERQKAWNGSVLAADCSDPDWRAHTVELGSYWVREFGCDGFRLDCGGSGQAPNWRPRSGLRANAAMLAGGIRQNALLRDAIRRINPDAILLPEAGATCNFESADLLFDYPLYMACREITRQPRADVWVRQTREWLAAQQMTHSPRQLASLVRFLENHDTVAAQDFFGVGPSHALTALCAFVPGVLLLHQEQEIGFAPELRTWLRLRRELPELKRGEADFDGVSAGDPGVMAFLRLTEDAASVVAINFGPREVACTLDWPEALARRLPICQDALTGKHIAKGKAVQIPAYGLRVLTLRASPRSVAEEPRGRARGGDSQPLVSEQTEKRVDDQTTRHIIRLAPVQEWFVRTGEGVLRDEFVDRHRGTKEGETHVDATPPLARCWRPLEHGLWDAGGAASFGAIAADGQAVEVRVTDKDQLRRARIDDPSSIGRRVAISLDAQTGARPFRVVERRDGRAFLRQLRRSPAAWARAQVEVEPLWVRASNEHYAVAFARRHGGTIFALRHAGASESCLAGGAEVYTDWGLFEKGLHVATEWETNPRLEVVPHGKATEITFRGRLHRPSWNGVQTGQVIGPEVAYRLTYAVDSSPVIRVTMGITPATDRPDAKAFLAYRIPFGKVDTWEASGADFRLRGRGGEKPGERVFQGRAAGEQMREATVSLAIGGRRVRIRSFTGDPAPPQNPFLLDSAGGTVHLFVAMLDGDSVMLRAGQERTVSFDIVFD